MRRFRTVSQHVLHRVTTRCLLQNPARREHRALRKGHSRAGPVCNLDPLTFTSEDHGVITHNISGADRAKANGVATSRAGAALASINGRFLKISAERLSNRFAQTECRARGGIDLVAVMRLDDLHVDAITQSESRSLSELEC